ncbi:MAG TPA: glycosyltransferase [Candidatus Saccharimonadales bacterium]|nr:glycosyltransferase [Candidatus Saccharimonadales bacterium]
MRVALVSPFVAAIDERAPQIGGAQAVVADLARGLAARGHEVTLLAPRRSFVTGAVIVDLGIDADPAAALGRKNSDASQDTAFAAVADWLASRSFDVVHGHAFDAPAFARLRGPHVLHTIHLPPIDPTVVAAVRATPATLATVSESCRAAWRSEGASVREVLPNGVDLAAVPAGDGTGGYLAFAGRMSAEKDPAAACRVARAAATQLRLAGPIYDERYFAREVAPLLGDGISYEGPLDRAALWRMLGAATVTLQPARWDEPFGMVALESIACGTPVVAYRRGGLADVIVDGLSGCLVTPGDEAGLLDAVGTAGGLSRAACRADAGRHDLGRMLDAHEALYRRLS